MELNHYAEEGSIETVMNVLGKLKVAVRAEDGTAFEKAEKVEYRQDSIAMFERLKNDEKNRSSGGISRKAGGCAGFCAPPAFFFDTAAYWRYNRAILWPCGPACVRPRGRPQSGPAALRTGRKEGARHTGGAVKDDEGGGRIDF